LRPQAALGVLDALRNEHSHAGGHRDGHRQPALARIARLAGAPQVKGAGVDLLCKVGAAVAEGQVLYRIHACDPADLRFACDLAARGSGWGLGTQGDSCR
jgi:thymidine phosphorylase